MNFTPVNPELLDESPTLKKPPHLALPKPRPATWANPAPSALVTDLKEQKLQRFASTPETQKIISTIQSAYPMIAGHTAINIAVKKCAELEESFMKLKALKTEMIRDEVINNFPNPGVNILHDLLRWEKFKEFWFRYMNKSLVNGKEVDMNKEDWFLELTYKMWDDAADPQMWDKLVDKYIEEQ